jgi:hypothetical protein
MSKEHEKTSQRQKKSKLRGSIDAETSGGPVGQVSSFSLSPNHAFVLIITWSYLLKDSLMDKHLFYTNYYINF